MELDPVRNNPSHPLPNFLRVEAGSKEVAGTWERERLGKDCGRVGGIDSLLIVGRRVGELAMRNNSHCRVVDIVVVGDWVIWAVVGRLVEDCSYQVEADHRFVGCMFVEKIDESIAAGKYLVKLGAGIGKAKEEVGDNCSIGLSR